LIRALSPFFFLLSGSVENPKGHRAESLSLDSEPKSVECGAWHEKINSVPSPVACAAWHKKSGTAGLFIKLNKHTARLKMFKHNLPAFVTQANYA